MSYIYPSPRDTQCLSFLVIRSKEEADLYLLSVTPVLSPTLSATDQTGEDRVRSQRNLSYQCICRYLISIAHSPAWRSAMRVAALKTLSNSNRISVSSPPSVSERRQQRCLPGRYFSQASPELDSKVGYMLTLYWVSTFVCIPHTLCWCTP